MYNDELMHYGVKGMKWGVRKTRKWATSKHQPSSPKSSVLAGLYAATGNKRIAKALNKSNDRDAENWKRSKEEYKRYQTVKAKKQKAKVMVNELEESIKKAKVSATNEFDDDRNGVSGNVWQNSKTMKEFSNKIDTAYKKRNAAYDKAKHDDEIDKINEEFHESVRKTIDDMFGKQKYKYIESSNDYELRSTVENEINRLVEAADWHDIGGGRYHPSAWTQYH